MRITTLNHYIGVDLGQRRDYTAIALVTEQRIFSGHDKFAHNPIIHHELHVSFLKRMPLRTPYTSLPPRLHRMAIQLNPIHTTIAVDASGPGVPVVDMLKRSTLAANLMPAFIAAAGDGKTMKNGFYTIGRNTLLSLLRIGLEQRMLKFAGGLRLRRELTAELTSLAVSPHRTAAHDDLAFAIALAMWAARTSNPSLLNVD